MRSNKTISARLVALAVVAVVAIGSSTAVAVTSSGGDGEAQPIDPVPGSQPVTELSPAQQSVGALRQPPSATTTLPEKLQSVITGVTQAGENPELGREALTTSFGQTLYVVPGANDNVCLNFGNGSAGCSPAEHINTGRFSGVMFCVKGVPKEKVIYNGMLPDGAEDVALTFADASERALDVTNNVYAVLLPRSVSPKSLSWMQDGVSREAPASPMPPARMQCGSPPQP
jgi:hypothetical protein